MDLERLLLNSIELVQAQAQARRALAEPRLKFRRYKTKHAILSLEKAHEHLSKMVEK